VTRELDPLIAALRERRYAMGLPLRVIADRTCFNEQTMWHWETGRAIPSLPKLRRWADALGVELRAYYAEPRSNQEPHLRGDVASQKEGGATAA
jgi:transcriptional regulator with XRE-family HTH domain